MSNLFWRGDINRLINSLEILCASPVKKNKAQGNLRKKQWDIIEYKVPQILAKIRELEALIESGETLEASILGITIGIELEKVTSNIGPLILAQKARQNQTGKWDEEIPRIREIYQSVKRSHSHIKSFEQQLKLMEKEWRNLGEDVKGFKRACKEPERKKKIIN